MDAPKTVAIVDLLMQRDKAFVDVYEAESAVTRILGRRYPFPPPPDIPSMRRSKSVRHRGDDQPSHVRLRNLHSEETAYRVTYTQGGEERVEVQTRLQPVRRVVECESHLPDFRIERIDIIAVQDDGTEVAYACLYDRTEASDDNNNASFSPH